MKTPTSRTLEMLRTYGYVCQVVERWQPPGIRIDLFGCIDIVAVSNSIIGVQATTKSNQSTRIKKAMTLPECSVPLKRWLEAGGKFFVYGWELMETGRGLWYPEVTEVMLVAGNFIKSETVAIDPRG